MNVVQDGRALHDGVPHYPQTRMRWKRDDGWMPNSQALISRAAEVTVALVFVHGWGGSATSTWEQFPQVISQMEEAGRIDAYFLDYPSTTRKVAFCADMLRQFLFDLAREPAAAVINGTLPAGAEPRSANESYTHIFIVAHSMGAVISRRALLDLELDRAELNRFGMLLFAPAHCGSNLALLIDSGLGLDFLPGAKVVGEAARIFLPSMRDLEPGGATLVQLADDARRRQEGPGESSKYLKARVYHAEKDRVVEQLRFVGDYPTVPVLRRTHRSICKPDLDYPRPAVALADLLTPVLPTRSREFDNIRKKES
jgi:pimeloyl-ACP methyl ester carboxylesterase